MIEINYQLLSQDALDNLLIEIITRQATDYGEFEVEIGKKKKQLLSKLDSGELVIIYNSKEGYCDIVWSEDLKKLTLL